jgi:hypothetical protein
MYGGGRRIDRLALAVHATAVALIVVVAGFLIAKYDSTVPSTAMDEARKWLDEQRRSLDPHKPAPPPPVAKPQPKRAVEFQVVDMRPAKEKRDHDALDSEGFQVLGDASLPPDRITVFRQHADARLAGKQVHLQKLMCLYVRTPADLRQQEMWQIGEMRSAPYWIVCEVAMMVDGQPVRGRVAHRFGGVVADLPRVHRIALLAAIDQAIAALPGAAKISFELIDRRPVKEREGFATAEYEVLGDGRFVPDRLSVVRERLAERLAGKQVQVTRLVTWYVKTPSADRAYLVPGQPWSPGIRRTAYWLVCDVTLAVGKQSVSSRSMQGFNNPDEFAEQHRRTLAQAVDGMVPMLLK